MVSAGRGDPSPFEEWRGEVGCLLLHGFPGSPAEVRELGTFLAEREISVVGPLLPGHGQRPEALYGIRWSDWLRAAAADLRRLQQHCSWVFAAGLSMGATLALYLAAEVPLAGVAALAPAVKVRSPLLPLIPLAKHVLRWIDLGEDQDLSAPDAADRHWYYTRAPSAAVAEMYQLMREAWKLAPQVFVPVLIIQSRRDGALHPQGAAALLERLGSEEKRLVWCEDSGHNLLVDAEREQVFAQVYGWIEQVVRS